MITVSYTYSASFSHQTHVFQALFFTDSKKHFSKIPLLSLGENLEKKTYPQKHQEKASLQGFVVFFFMVFFSCCFFPLVKSLEFPHTNRVLLLLGMQVNKSEHTHLDFKKTWGKQPKPCPFGKSQFILPLGKKHDHIMIMSNYFFTHISPTWMKKPPGEIAIVSNKPWCESFEKKQLN